MHFQNLDNYILPCNVHWVFTVFGFWNLKKTTLRKIFWSFWLWLICYYFKYVIGNALKCYTGEFVKNRDRNPMKPKLMDCDRNEDVCLSLYGKNDGTKVLDWTKQCFKRSELPEIGDKCIKLMVCNINMYVFWYYLLFSIFQTIIISVSQFR